MQAPQRVLRHGQQLCVPAPERAQQRPQPHRGGVWQLHDGALRAGKGTLRYVAAGRSPSHERPSTAPRN